MLELETLREQASLELVRKIVEEQIQRGTTIKQDQGTKQLALADVLGAQVQSMARSRRFSEVEERKQS
jgi:hypothetical protein